MYIPANFAILLGFIENVSSPEIIESFTQICICLLFGPRWLYIVAHQFFSASSWTPWLLIEIDCGQDDEIQWDYSRLYLEKEA